MDKLPEKWGLRVTKETINILEKWRLTQPKADPSYPLLERSILMNYPGIDNSYCLYTYDLLEDQTEISFEDFKRLVLKEESIPEYVECIASVNGNQNPKVGEILKVSKDEKGFAYLHGICIEGSLIWKTCFRPSTKEAFDLQNKPKEPELIVGQWYEGILPKNNKWLFKFKEIKDKVNLYSFKCVDYLGCKYEGSNNEHLTAEFDKMTSIKPANMEEVYKYFPEERPKEEALKVEKQQFKVGDWIKRDKWGTVAKITFIRSNGLLELEGSYCVCDPKAAVLATPEEIAKVIGKKEELMKQELTALPEKWYCISFDDESDKLMQKWRGGGHSSKIGDAILRSDKCWYFNQFEYKNGYTEITFEQFKKWVLKEDKLIEKKYDYEVVHCKSQEEWDFVCNKIKKGGFIKFSEDGYNCIETENSKYKNSHDKLAWFKEQNCKILSFEEWCTKFGHTFKPKSLVGRWVKWNISTTNGKGYKPGDYCLITKILEDGNFQLDNTTWNWVSNRFNNKDVELMPEGFIPPNTTSKIEVNTPFDIGSKAIYETEKVTMTKEEILAEAKRRYPIGTKVRSLFHITNPILEIDDTYFGTCRKDGIHVGAKDSNYMAVVYENGKWAEIVSKPMIYGGQYVNTKKQKGWIDPSVQTVKSINVSLKQKQKVTYF